jgi:uncharacterized membrane protein
VTTAFNPILPWPLMILVAAFVVAGTVWTYARRVRSGEGRWRWAAVGLRALALVLCFLAALRPSVLIEDKVEQDVAIALLLDDSASMSLADEPNSRTRLEVARETLRRAEAVAKKLGPKIEVRTFRFDDRLADLPDPARAEAKGPATGIGTAIDDLLKQLAGSKLLTLVLLSDGASNTGTPPLLAAERLKARQVPVTAVGFGSPAVAASRDLVARELIVGPAVFVKNQPAMSASIAARGFAGKTVDVELYAENQALPVATRSVKVEKPDQVLTLNDLTWIPERGGETRLTLKVKPQDGELVATNNEVSTFVNVQEGGLSVLYLQGPNFSWEYRYLVPALDASPELQASLRVMRRPAGDDPRILPLEELAPKRHDVIILSDVPASFLPREHRAALQRAVESGTGLMMLGGRSSFGAGGWASTDIAQILPTQISPTDGQLEPESGLKVVPDLAGIESYVLRLGATPQDTRQIWDVMPRISGSNTLGPAKRSAIILARADSTDGPPIMVAQDVAGGRVLAFGGETWPWARALNLPDDVADRVRAAHRKFWRQAILWLAHAEDDGTDQIRLSLDRRRVAIGQRLGITAVGRDARGEPMSDLRFEATVEPVRLPGEPAPGPVPKAAGSPKEATPTAAESIDLPNQGAEGRAAYTPAGEPGEYRVVVKGFRGDQLVGSDSARFLAYRDDRELEHPAADLALLDQIAKLTDGKLVSPEQLEKYLKALDLTQLTETVVEREVRLWDNWPFFLLFAAALCGEWWLRKRLGWV